MKPGPCHGSLGGEVLDPHLKRVANEDYLPGSMGTTSLDRLIGALPPVPEVHPAGSRQRFVVMAPFVLSGGEYRLLYEKRAAGIPQGDEICFPGGRVEPNLDTCAEDTAIRETVEELGIQAGDIHVLGRLDAMLTHWGGIIDVVIGTIEDAALSGGSPNPREVSRVITVPVSDLIAVEPSVFSLRVEVQPEYVDQHGERRVLFPARELGLPERYWRPWAGPPHSVFVYRYGGETIWGITAELTHRIVEIMRNPRG